MDLALAGLVHRNLMEVNAWGVRGSGGMVSSQDGEMTMVSPSALPFLNIVMREGPRGDPAELLRRARSLFFERARGFVVYTWPGDPELERAAIAMGMSAVMERY